MTEPVETKPPERIPSEVLDGLVSEIGNQLHEPNRALLRKIVIVLGVERAQSLLQQTLAIEAAGGQMTVDGTRRKTAGGVFISLARAQATDKKERQKLLDFPPKKKRDNAQGTDTPSIPALTWEEAQQLLAQALQSVGEARTVKITLIGRPSKVIKQAECVVLAMKGKEPPTFPKGLPTPPAGSAITWAVFVAAKQWQKVQGTIEANAEDQLILEGYPLVDPKSKANVVLVTSCKSIMQDKAAREAKKIG
jgi:hypothetical protein